MAERALRKQLAAFNAAHLGGPKPKVKKARKKAQAKVERKKKEKQDARQKNLHLINLLENSSIAQAKHAIAKQVRLSRSQ